MTDHLITYLERGAKSKGVSEFNSYQSPTLKDKNAILKKAPSFLERAKELLLSNSFKVENKLDEVSYCKYLACQHIIFFNQDPFFLDLFIQ